MAGMLLEGSSIHTHLPAHFPNIDGTRSGESCKAAGVTSRSEEPFRTGRYTTIHTTTTSTTNITSTSTTIDITTPSAVPFLPALLPSPQIPPPSSVLPFFYLHQPLFYYHIKYLSTSITTSTYYQCHFYLHHPSSHLMLVLPLLPFPTIITATATIFTTTTATSNAANTITTTTTAVTGQHN